MISSSSDINVANAVGGKSARACDNCIKKRARWYCAADDAFLCQSCDSSVHSANPLARRHERVRLKTSSSVKSFEDEPPSNSRLRVSVPSWHQGFKRKARTPRNKKHVKTTDDENQAVIGRIHVHNHNNPLHLVPEICSEEHSHEENEEQLLYRVPIFDPFLAELCTSGNTNDGTVHHDINAEDEGFGPKSFPNDFGLEMNHLQGFLPSEMDLAEFAADVESLLGKGLEDESFDMEGLGILESKECSLGIDRVKIEDEEMGEGADVHDQVGVELIDIGRETFELNFDYDSPVGGGEDEHKARIQGEGSSMMMVNDLGSCDDNKRVDDSKRKMFLRLDYDSIMSAWDNQKSPWTTGERPELDAGDCWPGCMGTCGTIHMYGEMGMMGGHPVAMADGGREARVSRYREKRRTRLFSKKIRYEVRKLNAEKRPRMKGRFVKRANLVSPATFPLLNK